MPQTHSFTGVPTPGAAPEPFTGPGQWREELGAHTAALLEPEPHHIYPVPPTPFCGVCLEDWPCNPARALATLEAQWAERR